MKNKSTLKLFGLLILSFLLAGCVTSSSIITDYDREADFSQYHTFYWSDEFQMENQDNRNNEPLFYNTLIKKRLKEAVQQEMEGRGYTLSGSDPDLLVNPQIVVQKSSDQSYHPYSYYYGYRWGYNNISSRDIKEGDVVIDLIDQDQRQLVWQGYAPGVLATSTKDKNEEIREAVSRIFSKYGRRAGESMAAEGAY